MSRIHIDLTYTPATPGGNASGFSWWLIVSGEEVDSGWSAGTKRDARREARIAAEQLGLITDGVDCNV